MNTRSNDLVSEVMCMLLKLSAIDLSNSACWTIHGPRATSLS